MKRFISSLKYLLAVLFWLAVWHIASVLIANAFVIVSPIDAFGRLFELAREGAFWSTISFSLVRIVSGFLAAMAGGVVLAALSARFKLLRILILPAINIVNAVPVASFVILVLFWIVPQNLSIFIAFVTVLPIAYYNTYEGIINTDSKLLEMARVFKVPKHKTILHIYAVSVLPHFIAAASSGLGFAFKSGIAAELIVYARGTIGFSLRTARGFLASSDVFAWTIAIVLLSYIMDKLFMLILKRVEKWQ